MRAAAAERTSTNPAVSGLVGELVKRLTRVLDTIGEPTHAAYVAAFMCLATAIDVAEALARKPKA